MHFKLCRCGKTIPLADKSCGCAKERYIRYNQTKRNKTSESFYNSREWKMIRKAALLRDKFTCQHCGKEAKHVDHIIELKDDWSLRLSLDNLQCLCQSCHTKKTLRVAKERNKS